MHTDAITISSVTAQRLLANQFPEWATESLTLITPEGTDNMMFRLGTDKVVRLPRTPRAVPSLAKECAWLPQLKPHLSLPVPTIIGEGNPTPEYPFPWSVMSLLPGTPPEKEGLDRNHTAGLLAEFIKELQKIDTAEAPVSTRNGNLLAQDKHVREGILKLPSCYDPNVLTDLWAESVAAPSWDKALVWTHGDLHPGNLLCQNRRITAIVDFGLMGVGDPAVDLMTAWTILDSESRNHFCDHLAFEEATWLRARGWVLRGAALAYPYYKDTNKALARISLNSLDEVLKDLN